MATRYQNFFDASHIERDQNRRTSVYKPTTAERDRVSPQPDHFKVSGDGCFATVQGEGFTAGKEAVFLRLQMCNLACGRAGGWKCDTSYTWDQTKSNFWREPSDWSYGETAEKIKSAWHEKFPHLEDNKRLVITGGEPLLQQDKIVCLLPLLPDWSIEIETNGTITPLPELKDCQFNCSPKLANSGNSLSRRYRPDVLRTINQIDNSWFKFVVSDRSDLAEVTEIVRDCQLDSRKIMIMPEGITAQQVAEHSEAIADEVRKMGWQIIMRHQLIWFGAKRRT